MLVKELLEDLGKLPPDYEIMITDYLKIPVNEEGEPKAGAEDEVIVCNDPLLGIAVSEESKQVRFVTQKSEEVDAIKELRIRRRF